jgi:hypothetical protein
MPFLHRICVAVFLTAATASVAVAQSKQMDLSLPNSDKFWRPSTGSTDGTVANGAGVDGNCGPEALNRIDLGRGLANSAQLRCRGEKNGGPRIEFGRDRDLPVMRR